MTTIPSSGSFLVLSSMGVPFYSARGLTQTLTQIDQAREYRRDVNGVLVDISSPKFRKYASTISCTDQAPPAVDSIHIGQIVMVDCVAELSYSVTDAPSRPVIDSRTVGGHVFYRPRLQMMIINYSMSLDEWGAETDWSIDLEEV